MLKGQREQFARNIVEGMSQADAYRAAYPKQKMSDKTIWETASRLAKDPKVEGRIKELRDQLAKESIMSAQQRLEWLTKQVEDDENMLSDKLRAIDIMNKMTGEYVQKIEADVKSDISINIELTDES